MDKIQVKIENVEVSSSNNNTDNLSKPALSSTKSIDEGFESDPDRELSNTESDASQQQQQQQQLQPGTVVVQSPAFDVLQTTDRDGVQHTQITRRPLHTDFRGHKTFESGGGGGGGTSNSSINEHLRRTKEQLEKNRIVYTNHAKVSIPRAGTNASNQRIITTNGSIQVGPFVPSTSTLASSTSATSTIDHHQYRHKQRLKPIELGNSRLAKSTELMLRSGGSGSVSNHGRNHERLNFPTTMNDHNLSQVALINGKLICVNMPVTQMIPAASIPSGSASVMANAAAHNHIIHNSKRHFPNSCTNTSCIGNQATKISGNSNNNCNGNSTTNNHHHQKYISSGRNSSSCNGSASHNCIVGNSHSHSHINDPHSIAHQMNHAIMQNANSSIHTFYPAEGNISLIQSQYGLKYKSTHLNGIQEQPAPISLWSQSLARQPRR